MQIIHKYCDDYTRDLIFGFVRTIQNSINRTIPTNIIQLCLRFYFIMEKWVSSKSKFIELSQDQRLASNHTVQLDAVYGNYEIDSNNNQNHNRLFEWTFYIQNTAKDKLCIGMALVQKRHSVLNSDNCYFLCANSTLNGPITNDIKLVSIHECHECFGCKDGAFYNRNTIMMQLNLKYKTLTWYQLDIRGTGMMHVISQIQGIQTKGVKYRIASSFGHHGCIEIKDFKAKSHSN